MDNIFTIKALLQQACTVAAEKRACFYKTAAGQYAAHDQFIGVTVPVLRKIAKQFIFLSLDEIQMLLGSPVNEERALALFILVLQYQKADDAKRESLYQFYKNHLRYVNNWNLVDASAHLILGAHLHGSSKEMLITLAQSTCLWERRIAIVATWYFIRNNELDWTFKIAIILLYDQHDLIHKAVGWMLREAGKRDRSKLADFLDNYAARMPRTMLRYAIEKFSESERKGYLLKGKQLRIKDK